MQREQREQPLSAGRKRHGLAVAPQLEGVEQREAHVLVLGPHRGAHHGTRL